MSFILATQRDEDCDKAFSTYRSYLASVADRFPKSAYALATADWYYDFTLHHCPHDARLVTCTIEEPADFEWHSPSIQIRLLGAYDDGFVEFTYSQVFRFDLGYRGQHCGHQDWRYDEFRLSEDGHVIHEIEWAGAVDTGRWLIEASDVSYKWVAKGRQ